MAATDEPDDEGRFVPPLPREDRLWRHPSEMGVSATAGAAGAPRPPAPVGPSGGPIGGAGPGASGGQGRVVLVSAVAGVVLTLGVLAVIGAFDGGRPQVVIEQVAVGPPTPGTTPVEVLGPSLARVDARRGTGRTPAVTTATAVVYRSDGHLLTTATAVEGADSLSVTLADGRVLDAELVGTDDVTGVAVLDVDADGLTPVVMAGDGALHAGDPALVVTRPPDPAGSPAVVAGQVMGLGWRADDGTTSWHDLIRAVVPSPVDEPGAVLCDRDGHVVGLVLGLDNTTGTTPPNAAEAATIGIADTTGSVSPPGRSTSGSSRFATPIGLAVRAADDLVATGRTQWGWLGVMSDDVDVERATALGRSGAVLTEITPDSPADRAGLRPGDVVLAVGERAVTSASGLVVAVRDQRPGTTVTLSVQRGDRRDDVTVDLTIAP